VRSWLKDFRFKSILEMKKLAFVIVALTVIGTSNAQIREGDIIMQKTFGGVKFYQDTRLLKPKEVLATMEPNTEAFNAFKKAKSNYDAANVFGFIGGFMIGWPLGTAVAGGDPEWGIAAGGAAFALIAIPLTSSFKKHAKNAVDLYNNGELPSASLQPRIHMQFMGTGAKLIVVF
jgi:hypothetical protein